VDWPELQLTEEQTLALANAIAAANGQPAPYPDWSLFAVELERVFLPPPDPRRM